MRFHGFVFLVGVAISALSLRSAGCGRLFQTGLFWMLAYSWPQLGRGAFVINAVFHRLSLVLLTCRIGLGLRLVTNSIRRKVSSATVALVLYCLLLWVFFPIRECL